MWFDIDQKSSIPIYQQLINNIKLSIARGILISGEKLPSVRELASNISINPNTIAKTYQELEKDGVIETLKGKGTFVSTNMINEKSYQGKELIESLLEKVLVEAYYLKINKDDLKNLFIDIIEKWYRKKGDDK